MDAWLRSVLWDETLPSAQTEPRPTDFDIHRLKGILAMEDGLSKIIQAVRDVFEIRDSEPRVDDSGSSKTQCKIVLIGRGLGGSAQPWQTSFETFLARDD